MTYNDIKPYLSLCSIKQYDRGSIIYSTGGEADHLYFINFGLVGLFHTTQNGRETFLRIFSKDSYFGHRSFFAQESYHANSIALVKSEIIIIPKAVSHKVLQSNPGITQEILKQVSKDLALAEIRLARLQDHSANKRIAHTLLYLKLRYPDITWTRKEIAEYSCSSAESVARLMSSLEENNIIEKRGRDFKILSEENLLNFNS